MTREGDLSREVETLPARSCEGRQREFKEAQGMRSHPEVDAVVHSARDKALAVGEPGERADWVLMLREGVDEEASLLPKRSAQFQE